MQALFRISITVVTITALIGCTGGGGPSAEGQAFLLNSKPAGAMDVKAMKQALSSDEAPEGTLVIQGRVGGPEEPGWDPTQAVFLLRDLTLEIAEHDHAGGHDNCKYCQQDKAAIVDSLALVQMVDDSGNVVPTDVRELLGVKANHVVVAEGHGEVDTVGDFVFSATKIYIQP